MICNFKAKIWAKTEVTITQILSNQNILALNKYKDIHK